MKKCNTRQFPVRKPESDSSIDAGDDLPRNPSTILIPRCTILPAAAPVVAGSAVGQEKGQVDHIKIGDEMGESRGQAPGKCESDLRHIMEVARHAPPAGSKQETFVLPVVGGCVGCADQIRRTAPHGCGTICRTYPL